MTELRQVDQHEKGVAFRLKVEPGSRNDASGITGVQGSFLVERECPFHDKHVDSSSGLLLEMDRLSFLKTGEVKGQVLVDLCDLLPAFCLYDRKQLVRQLGRIVGDLFVRRRETVLGRLKPQL